MNTELLQQRHNEMQQRLMMIRESLRQTEGKLQDLHDQEQNILGAIGFARELMSIQAQLSAPQPVQPNAAPVAIQTDAPQPVDNAAQ